MAGIYPDVPAPRMAYHRDGTVGFQEQGGVITQVSVPGMSTMNDEDDDNISFGSGCCGATVRWGFIFPQLRNSVAYFLNRGKDANTLDGSIYTSVDTTNGLDGTWVNRGAYVIGGGGTSYRSSITPFSFSGIRAIKFDAGSTAGGTLRIDVNRFHLYGNIATGQTPDRLRMWHATLDQELGGAAHDQGDIPRNSQGDRFFRVRNNSSIQTANGVIVGTEVLSDKSPSMTGQYLYSFQNSGFSTSVTIGNIPPGGTSDVITIRRITSPGAQLGLGAGLTVATATSWL